MAKNKKLTKAIRERMARTGEPYTTARMHLLSKLMIPSEEEHAEHVQVIAKTLREGIWKYTFWNRLLLDQSGWPEEEDGWEGLYRFEMSRDSAPQIAGDAFHGRTALLQRAGDLARVHLQAAVVEKLLAEFADRSDNITGRAPAHVYKGRFNNEIDVAIDRHEARWGRDTGCGHVLLNARDYTDLRSAYKATNDTEEVTWTCGCGETHVSTEPARWLPLSRDADPVLLRCGVVAHYRGYEIITTRFANAGTVVVLPDPTYLGRIRFEVDVIPGKRGEGVAIKAEASAKVEVGLEPDAPIYLFTR